MGDPVAEEPFRIVPAAPAFDANGTPPTGLTDFDQAYLRSLYGGIANIRGITKINGVDRELRELREEKAEARE